MANDVGERYACEECGAIFLVVKAGAGTIECHGRPTPPQATKQLPSSD
jgi:desulfoferrodoxin-like iron-binding protein